jgi:hypothetical protein
MATQGVWRKDGWMCCAQVGPALGPRSLPSSAPSSSRARRLRRLRRRWRLIRGWRTFPRGGLADPGVAPRCREARGAAGPFGIRDGEAGGGQIHHDPHVTGSIFITAKMEKAADLPRS